ncbi:cofactor-independent phosphoglycerate mutase [Frigoriglobus tundricola]|uniref:Cofactor-independent phosphoglycerate mutase n=1 Tax=Frigoriglobus tundricola TaxID=2774151 RepID=A0A6M5YQG7_9BACT|nr:cofactor-independent phosphoglycerate mutase [Frigoriglobus tundricola]QJW95481.1 Cofactor-independent phosphoglycerate mutase [Frigoriglobus tundricola]
MKYVIVIPDGCADDPVAELGGLTPLQAANLPNMDRVARAGVVGLSNNVPPSLTPASDVATLSLFGYDPLKYYTGRAPLETAAMGIHLGPNDWAVRCNLVYAPDGHMRDFTAGHISSEDGAPLVRALQHELGGRELAGGTLEFHPGVQYRNILVWRGHAPASPLQGTRTQAPHDIPDRPVADYLPQGPGAELLVSLMEASKPVLAAHPVNARRTAGGQKPATQIWLWGQGQAPRMAPFADVYGCRGAIISAVDLVRGVGVLLGWHRIDVPGATGYLDTSYANKGKYAIEALGAFDLVCVHVEAPDEASHEGKVLEKVRALERIDEHIVGPLLDALPRYGAHRVLVEPDHRTTLATRAHAHGAVAFAACGSGIAPDGADRYDEPTAATTGLSLDPGWQLMNWWLGR